MLIIEIPYRDPISIMQAFYNHYGSVLFDGGLDHYSFIAIDPFLIVNKNSKTVFADIERIISTYPLESEKDLPPFQGGIAGYWAYDLCAEFENIKLQSSDYCQVPGMIVGAYDLVIGFDHMKKQAWIFSSGYPDLDVLNRSKRAEKRMRWVEEKIQSIKEISDVSQKKITPIYVQSNFTRHAYCHAVERVVEYIRAGDVFETNIAQRFEAKLPKNFSSFDLYKRLRIVNNAPFSSYMNWGDIVLVSASPERFLSLKDGIVQTKPIKGTAPRGKNKEEDQQLANTLLSSEKDRAENVMIVDLMRNDLSKVCLPDTVIVNKLCALESFSTVHHLVSTIQAQLLPTKRAAHLLEACFPGGSVTGAPKVRSMEIIAEIEPHRRGPYCGAIGYIGFSGDMDTAITIRTYAIKDQHISFHGGGAVVLDSDPEAEYQETLHKVGVLRKLLEG